jgi:hypothetical protein
MFVEIILSLLCLGLIVNEIGVISVVGFPPKDKDVLEFLEKVRESNPYMMDGSKPQILLGSTDNPYISNSIRSCLIGCYIQGVGAIPRWYKSYGEIKKLYVKLREPKKSKTKRQKLGL